MARLVRGKQTSLCGPCTLHNREYSHAPLAHGSKSQNLRRLLPASSPLLLLSQPTHSQLSPSEVIYFDFFQHQVARQFASQEDGPAEFWTRTVLRESTRHDSILDVIIGIGAVAKARSLNSDTTPLFKKQLSDCPSDVHYCKAIKYYTRALGRFRTHISSLDIADLPRTILVATLLWSAFERLQGNLDAVDKVMANGINFLKDVLLQTSNNGSNSRVAAPLDDEGILNAEYFLARTVTWNAQFLPMYSRETDSILSIASSYGQKPPSPDPMHSLEELWKTWWRFVTYTTIWTNRVVNVARTSCLINMDPVLRDEHRILLSQTKTWEAEIQKRLEQENRPLACCTLRQTFLGAKAVWLALSCRLDATGALWDAHKDAALEALHMFSSIMNERLPPSGQPVVYDVFMLAMIAQQCRDSEVRSIAMRLLGIATRPNSSWDEKALFLGTSTLISTEERSRDNEGVIPFCLRYDWTHGGWNDDYTGFQITLTQKIGVDGQQRQQKHITLCPKNFGLI